VGREKRDRQSAGDGDSQSEGKVFHDRFSIGLQA
jgi:hypothetical protein